MECCQTTPGSAYCMPCASRLDMDLAPRAEAMGEFLKFMISPENSNTEGSQPGPARAFWMGAAKTLFWTVMAVAVGVALATLCS